MKRSTRLIKITVIIVGIIIFLAIIFSKVIFSSDRLTALVLPRISQLLNRDVSAEQVELSFFPTIGIRIRGLRVSNPDYGKFDSPFLLDAKAVVIDAKILPLLKNRLEINNVIFYSPAFYIEQNLKGKLNTERLLNDSFYREQRNIRGSLSSLLLSNFEISNGNIILYDDKTGVSAKFLNVDFTSRIKTVVEENKLILNSKLNVAKFELWKDNSELFNGSPIDIAAKLDYDKRHDLVHIQSDNASIFGIKLRSSVSFGFYPRPELTIYTINADSSAKSLYNILPEFLQNVIMEKSIEGKLALEFHYVKRDGNPDMDFLFHLKNFHAKLQSGDSLSVKELMTRYDVANDSSFFRFSIPNAVLGENYASFNFTVIPPKVAMARVLVDLDLKKLARNLEVPDVDRFSGSLRAKYNFNYDSKSNRVNADGLVTFANALMEIPVGIDTLYRGEFDGSISLKNNYATFNKMLVRLGATDLVLTGTLTNYQNVLLGNKTMMPSLKLSIVSKTFSTIGLLPHMNLNLGRQSLAWVPTANVALDFNINRFILPTDTLSRVSGRLELLDYFVKLKKLNYTSSLGNFSVTGWTDYSQEGRTTFSMKTQLTTANFGKLIHRYLGKVEIVGGGGKGTIALNGVYSDSGKVDLATLGGRGQFRLSNVSIKNYSVLNKLYNFLGASGKDSLKLNNASFTFDVTDGRIYFNRLVAYGRPFDFKLDGWHGFDGTLDYKLAMKIYPPMSAQITHYLKALYSDLSPASDGTLALGLVAGGTTSDARFTIIAFRGRIANNGIKNKNFAMSLR